MNCLLDAKNSQSRRHFRSNVQKQAPDCLAQSQLAISPLFPTQSTAAPCLQPRFGQSPWESFLNSLSCLTYDSSVVPAHTGLGTHSQFDVFSPFTVTTLVTATTASHLDHCNHFQSFSLLTSLFYFCNGFHALQSSVFERKLPVYRRL